MRIPSEIGSAPSLWLLAPILWVQGLYVKKKTPRLPGAAGPTTGSLPGAGRAVRLLAVGESTVAGVGAPDHASGLTGKTAAAIRKRTGRAVEWRAVGKIGVTARAARRELLPQVPRVPVDVAVLVLGVNDVLEFNSPRRWSGDLAELIAELRARIGPAAILIAGVPPLGQVAFLPQPLRGALGLRAGSLDIAARRLAEELDRVTHCPGRIELTREELFCADRFHPSVEGYEAWGKLLACSIEPLLASGPA